jgi:hypothetical protein
LAKGRIRVDLPKDNASVNAFRRIVKMRAGDIVEVG